MSEITISNPKEGKTPEGGKRAMSIEQYPQQGTMKNAAGEEVRLVQLNDGTTDLVTFEKYNELVAAGRIDVPHSGEPVPETATKITETDTKAQVPDKMLGYTPDEAAHASLVQEQAQAAQQGNPPAHDTLEPKDRSKRNLFIKIGVAVSAVALAAVVAGKMNGDDASKNPGDREPTASSGVEAGTGDVVKTPEQEMRDEMFYTTDASDVVDPEFAQLVAEQGGYDPSMLDENVDQEAAATVAQTFLSNITVAEETGDPDAILAAFSQTAPGNGDFGENQVSVDQIKANHENIEQNISEDPSYPISSLQLSSIEEIVPGDDPEKFGMRMLVSNTFYGNYTTERDIAEFSSLEEWYVDFERSDVEGWSDGGSRRAWTAELYTKTVLEDN